MTDALATAVDRIASLYEREVQLRSDARILELAPSRSEEARSLFRRASAARRLRLALLRQWRLI